MHRFLLLTTLTLAGATPGAAQGRIDLDESGIRAELKAAVTNVSIPVHNSRTGAAGAQLRLEWLDQKNRRLSTRALPISIKPGKSRVGTAFPLPAMSSNDQVYLRLRYTLAPADATPRSFSDMTGTVALSAIAPHAFALQTGRSNSAQPGTDYVIRAQAVHSATRKTVPGVRFESVLLVDGKQVLPSSTRSDAEGTAVFTFAIPPHVGKRGKVHLRTSAHLGDYRQKLSESLSIQDQGSARIETDKSLYQPGQTLHMRAIVLDAAGRAAAQIPVKVQVRDPSWQVIREVRLTASRFGVVHEDFELPATAYLGPYQISVEDERTKTALASDSVTLSRYELPAFTVAAKPDHPFYLPGQDAAIDVSAAYLFAKPVPRAKVLVVRPRIVEGALDSKQVAAGEADSSGHFLARIPLGPDHADLEKTPGTRFEDLTFEAYCTDPGSGRTEQIRFDVRISHEPIHVYVTRGEHCGGPLPVPVYVSTWYADGTPAETTAQVRLGGQSATVRTNRFGIGKVLLAPHGGPIDVEAVDVAGMSARWQQYIGFWDTPTLRVQPDKSIYRHGEPVTLTIEAPDAELDIAVNAVSNERTIESRRVHLTNGMTRLEFPYRPEFRRLVTFAAFTGDEREGYAAVVYPDGATLRVNATPERREYRPGEDAGVWFSVSAAAGQIPQAVLGVAIVDQAVAERARTDTQFGQRWSGCNRCTVPDPGGLTLEALYRLDLSQPIPPGFELAAEALLASQSGGLDLATNIEREWRGTFEFVIDRQFGPVIAELDRIYAETLSYPRDRAALSRIFTAGLSLDDLRDPWSKRYAIEFVTEGGQDTLRFRTAGPDKVFGTEDDFTAQEVSRPHFRPYRIAIERALVRLGQCAGDLEQIRRALATGGLLLDALKDPWGTAYRVSLESAGWSPSRVLAFTSAGPDRKFNTWDDFQSESIDVPCPVPYEQEIRRALDRATTFPLSEGQFRKQLAAAGIDAAKLVDPYGVPYSLEFEVTDRFADVEHNHPVRLYPGLNAPPIKPLTQRKVRITLRSTGKRSSLDNGAFVATTFEGILDPVPLGAATGTGALCGVVRSEHGAVLAGAAIKLDPAAESFAGPRYQTRSNAEGGYCFRGVAPGRYTMVVERRGHQPYELEQIPVADGYMAVVNVSLQSAPARFLAPRIVDGVPSGISGGVMGGLSTPRVREYFPETLLWAPEVETDAQGRARLGFKLADNITNWQVAVTASTPDGRMARSGADIRAFQPFFVDLNPPPVLTAGDRIDLPLPVRNYLDQAQPVTVELQPNAWSELKGPARVRVDVPSNGSQKLVFPLLARTTVDAGRMRATAIGASASDAMEKPVRVHPDGQETVQSVGDLISGRTRLKLAVPSGAVSGSTHGELRIYPSALATLRDAIEGMLARPYGCAEQTTSAGQSNLVALRYARSVGFRNPAFEKQAIRNLELTRDRLESYRARGGGFSYWGHGPADLAVSGYVLRFLAEASEAIQIDRRLIGTTATWLMKQRGADRQWGADTERSWATTAVVVRGLAAARRRNPSLPAPELADLYAAIAASAPPNSYAIAQLALAALDLSDTVTARKAVTALKQSAREDSAGSYWLPPTGTAFGGWGRAATLETTAAAVTALARWRNAHPAEATLDPLVRRGILHLLRNRDRYGVWFSTQATVAAMQAVAAAPQVGGGASRHGGTFDIGVNGRPLRRAILAQGDALRVDLSRSLVAGANEIEISPSPGSAAMVAMASVTHWLPWTDAAPRNSAELDLKVAYDRTTAQTGETIECRVEARRSKGFGMLLSEIGLPPGAEVDRASLEQVLRDPLSGLYRYDVLPDRVILYLWPQGAEVSLRFRFHARFGMEAKSASSLLYDYYNPEAMTEVPPTLFHIR